MERKFPEIQKHRDGTADLLKGIAVLLMIQVHVMEQMAAPDLYNSMIGRVSLFLGGPACAPVFMAVMGYFMACSKKNFRNILKRGILLIGGGILLNTGRSAHLIILVLTGKSSLDPWQFIFGADILTLAGLSIIAIVLLRFLFKTNYLPYILMAAGIVIVSPYLEQQDRSSGFIQYITAFLWGRAGWSYFPLFPWMAYVLTGYAFRLFMINVKWVKRIDLKEHIYFTLPLWIILAITIPWASAITSDLTGKGGYYHHGILFFLWTLLFMFSYLALIIRAEASSGQHWLPRAVKWVGIRVTSLYVIQWLIIGNLAAVLYRSQNLFQATGLVIAVTLVTILAGMALQKMRNAKSEM